MPLRWTYAGDAGKRLASDGHFILPTPSVTPQLKKNEKMQADFENLGAKLQARRAITRPAMEQARKQKADDEEAAGKRSSTSTVCTCDLSHDYVSINADYRS